jgi:hypothetical protein
MAGFNRFAELLDSAGAGFGVTGDPREPPLDFPEFCGRLGDGP